MCKCVVSALDGLNVDIVDYYKEDSPIRKSYDRYLDDCENMDDLKDSFQFVAGYFATIRQSFIFDKINLTSSDTTKGENQRCYIKNLSTRKN